MLGNCRNNCFCSFLSENIVKPRNKYVWIGLRDATKTKSWKWLNGKSLSGYGWPWSRTQISHAGKQNCVVWSPLTGKWFAQPCDGPFTSFPLCEKPSYWTDRDWRWISWWKCSLRDLLLTFCMTSHEQISCFLLILLNYCQNLRSRLVGFETVQNICIATKAQFSPVAPNELSWWRAQLLADNIAIRAAIAKIWNFFSKKIKIKVKLTTQLKNRISAGVEIKQQCSRQFVFFGATKLCLPARIRLMLWHLRSLPLTTAQSQTRGFPNVLNANRWPKIRRAENITSI